MKFSHCLAILACAMLSCNTDNSRQPENQVKEVTADSAAGKTEVSKTLPDSIEVIKKDSIQFTEKHVYGLYEGVVPCSDCKGIRQMILFSPKAYHLEEDYQGKDADLRVDEGTWSMENNRILLKSGSYGGAGNNRYFRVENRSLLELDSKGEIIKRENNEKYRLQKKVIGASNKAWMEKKKKGIDFICVGNEPFWSLELDKGRKISFLLAETMVPVDFPYAVPANEGGVLKYSVQAGTNRLELSIEPKFCGDGMSDTWYEYEVKLKLNDVLYKGCGIALRSFY